MDKIFYCPTYEVDCPYCKRDGRCIIGDPLEECDIYMFYHGDELEDEEE